MGAQLSCTDRSGLDDQLVRSPHYVIEWLTRGSANVRFDTYTRRLVAPVVIFFYPMQPHQVRMDSDGLGIRFEFDSDFYCIEKHRREVSCSGILFGAVYSDPSLSPTPELTLELERLRQRCVFERARPQGPDNELLRSQLKIMLIVATRLKSENLVQARPTPERLEQFRQLVEDCYNKEHAPAAYAQAMNLTPRGLGRLVKSWIGKTVSETIRDRIILEAKRELILTEKLVKEIAGELGFDDVLYFSRFFKHATGVSCEQFRIDYL